MGYFLSGSEAVPVNKYPTQSHRIIEKPVFTSGGSKANNIEPQAFHSIPAIYLKVEYYVQRAGYIPEAISLTESNSIPDHATLF